jgi:hypothetical protein
LQEIEIDPESAGKTAPQKKKKKIASSKKKGIIFNSKRISSWQICN